jgi:hypothetical protein
VDEVHGLRQVAKCGIILVPILGGAFFRST